MEEEFDFSLPLQYAISQLNAIPTMDEIEDDESFVHFPKPSSLSAMADSDDDPKPATINDIIDELVANFDNYPKLVQVMMQRGFLRKRQQCRKCDRMMHLRRRKNAYEWRCRTRDKRGDCSSCSIKYGSWFEFTKLPFKSIFNCLIMHCKNCSSSHMINQLKLSTHSLNEVRKVVFELSERIQAKYPQLGGKDTEVYIELISIGTKHTDGSEYKVLAGQELGSKRCFVRVLPDEKPSTIEKIRYEQIAPSTRVTVVVTVNEEAMSYASQSAEFIDESTLGSSPDMFFTNLRNPIPEVYSANPKTVQKYLNDVVVRRTEGLNFLEACVKELMTYT